MRLSSLWVVTDATESSTLADICWQASDPVQLANIIVGAGGSQVVAREGWVFYTTEAEAKRDAGRRLQVAEIKSEQASAYRRDRQLTPADVVRLFGPDESYAVNTRWGVRRVTCRRRTTLDTPSG